MAEKWNYIECYYCRYQKVCEREGDKCKIIHTDRGDKIDASMFETTAEKIYNDFMKGDKKWVKNTIQ